jgi:hypothetical protein
VHLAAAGEFHLDGGEAHHQHAADIQEEPVEAAAPWGLGAIHVAEDQDQRAQMHRHDASGEHHVRRAENLDVEAVGVMPPVVEGRRGKHGDAAPGGDEGAERAAEPPDFDRSFAERGHAAHGGGEDQVSTGDAGEDAA